VLLIIIMGIKIITIITWNLRHMGRRGENKKGEKIQKQ